MSTTLQATTILGVAILGIALGSLTAFYLRGLDSRRVGASAAVLLGVSVLANVIAWPILGEYLVYAVPLGSTCPVASSWPRSGSCPCWLYAVACLLLVGMGRSR